MSSTKSSAHPPSTGWPAGESGESEGKHRGNTAVLDIDNAHGRLLAKLARQAIAYRLTTGGDLPPASKLPDALMRPAAAFVSLHRIPEATTEGTRDAALGQQEQQEQGRRAQPPRQTAQQRQTGEENELRGCMGTLLAKQPLIESALSAALEAALADPRFPPVQRAELDTLAIKVAVLSEPEPLLVNSQQELLNALRPGEDGLILRDGLRRATFLPAVWESLPDPLDFVTHLKAKASLPPNHWSPTLQVARYRSVTFVDPPPQQPQ
nr:AmmeMemoRadiSam system protein A [Halorhodospira abdelmalekii]